MATIDECARAGMKALEDQRFDDAVEAFERAVRLDPSRPDMHNALAMAHLHRGDARTALTFLERAVELAEPYDAPEHQALKREFHLSLAGVLQLLDRFDDAHRTLRGAVERWPDEPAPRMRLAQLLALAGRVPEAEALWRELLPRLGAEDARGVEALLGALEAFRASGEDASLFLRAHQGSYCEYFDTVAEQQPGWYAEAARMARGADGEPVPIVAEGARPWALTRVDLVNPADGTVSAIYSDREPMIVAVEGLEPLAQVPLLLPWRREPFEVLVSTWCPWHWLPITIRFAAPDAATARVDRLDAVLGDWYLRGYNGDFGEADRGRFHYASDPEAVGDRAVSWVVDLGRTRFDAVPALLEALAAVHRDHPIERVVFGKGL